MDVKQAVSAAKEYVSHVFSDEQLANIRLEEVEYDESDAAWNITFGFFRPIEEPLNKLIATLAVEMGTPFGAREYKVVRINDATAKVISIKTREPNQ